MTNITVSRNKFVADTVRLLQREAKCIEHASERDDVVRAHEAIATCRLLLMQAESAFPPLPPMPPMPPQVWTAEQIMEREG